MARAHDHDHCIDRALARAEAVCQAKNLRLTPLRREVLRHVWDSHKPIGAYDIMQLMAEPSRRVAPPTVYRALEFLLDHGLIHRVESQNAYLGCPEPEPPHVAQLFLCTMCGVATECRSTAVDSAIEQQAARLGFAVRARHVEIEGTCPACQRGTA